MAEWYTTITAYEHHKRTSSNEHNNDKFCYCWRVKIPITN
jgi:hypothetical protein